MAQSVKRLALGFGSGHDLMICEFEPHLGSALTLWSLLGILSPSLYPAFPSLCVLFLSLSVKLNK